MAMLHRLSANRHIPAEVPIQPYHLEADAGKGT